MVNKHTMRPVKIDTNLAFIIKINHEAFGLKMGHLVGQTRLLSDNIRSYRDFPAP